MKEEGEDGKVEVEGEKEEKEKLNKSIAGAMKLAGEAVKEGQFLVNDGSSMKRGLKCIGICAWGYTHDNQVK